jgi:hypothetical protein
MMMNQPFRCTGVYKFVQFSFATLACSVWGCVWGDRPDKDEGMFHVCLMKTFAGSAAGQLKSRG